MKKLFCILCLSWLCTMSYAQQTTILYSQKMHTMLSDYIDELTFTRLCTAAAFGAVDTVQNVFGGKTYIELSSASDICFHVAQDITFHFYNRGGQWYLIKTFCAPLCTSEVLLLSDDFEIMQTIHPTDDVLFSTAEITPAGDIVWHNQTEYNSEFRILN